MAAPLHSAFVLDDSALQITLPRMRSGLCSSVRWRRPALGTVKAAELSKIGHCTGGGRGEEVEVVGVGETYSYRKLDGTYLTNEKNEWVEKSRLVLSTPVKGEATDITEDQDMAENGMMAQLPGDEDSEPEMKVEATEDLENSLESESEYLATESEDLAEELKCPLCKGLLKDPVIISCSHNFCRSCIEDAWNGQESFVCPDCKTVITDKMCIPNLTLENLVRKLISISIVNSPMTPMPMDTTMIHANCPEHDERLKLFCKDDGTLSCLICRDSMKHSGHNFLPIPDAVEVYRTQLSALTALLQEALKATRQLNSNQREKIQQVKTNMEEFEQHVVTEFKKLEDFVQQQEEMLLWHLRVQGKDVETQMENNLTKVQENEKNLEQAISLADEKFSVTEATSFLTGTKSLIDKCREQQAQFSSSILVDKQLNDSTYKGPIMYSVWKEMRSLISSDSDQDNLAAQAPEKPATGPRNNRRQTKPVPRGTAPNTGNKQILIFGNAVISQAEEQAKVAYYGHDLGFGQENYSVHWASSRDMVWDSLLPELKSKVAVMGVPRILVIHVGEDDLASVSTSSIWKHTTRSVFKDIRAQYKDTEVFWSVMLPKVEWRFTACEKRRRNYNRITDDILYHEFNYKVIRHATVDKMFRERCGNQTKSGEVSEYSAIELDTFCIDIRDAIRGVLGEAEPAEGSS
ncbi:nuclear factor 7, ovary-like [Hyperolius riggenbachi]|uniref:nuclear factor 7, ovary-like n=1 Tax=Hyperolius riggenbachi TaxID=752182 RepID=UPI0035A2A5BA